MNSQLSSNQASSGRGSVKNSFLIVFGVWIGAFVILMLLTGQESRAQSANTLPSGGLIVSGSGRIDQNGNSLTVTQNTDKMIAQWGSFNIGQNASVQFKQPGASSVALNRILDANPSQILGSLTAN